MLIRLGFVLRLSRGLVSLLLTLTPACSCVYICKFQFRPIHPPSRRLSVGDFLKRRITPLQQRACLCCCFTGSNDIGWIQRKLGTDLSWEELEVLVKGITGESSIPESLILPKGIPALCDDAGLRSVNLATLPTLDECGVAVRQTSGRDPHRGIQIGRAHV